MNVTVKIGNPIILTEADVQTYRKICDAADTAAIIDALYLNVESMTIVARGVKKTLKYPVGADVQWVLQQITKTSGVVGNHYKTSDKRSNDFINLCINVLNEDGKVWVENDVLYFHRVRFDKYGGEPMEFKANCPVNLITENGMKRIYQEIERKEAERARAADTERLREIARANGLKV